MSLFETVTKPFQCYNRYQLAIQDCHTPLDVESFIGREAISETYRYQITFTSPDKNLQAQHFLRRTDHFTFSSPTIPLVTLSTLNEPQKRIHGVVIGVCPQQTNLSG